jgi:hypothetical protein
MPVLQDIERFMVAMIDITRSRYHSSEALSYSWAYHGIKFVITTCNFDFDDFKLPHSAGARLESLVEGYLREGKLTKDPFREKQWAGSHIISRIVSALLVDALDSGTLSWDVSTCRAASWCY